MLTFRLFLCNGDDLAEILKSKRKGTPVEKGAGGRAVVEFSDERCTITRLYNSFDEWQHDPHVSLDDSADFDIGFVNPNGDLLLGIFCTDADGDWRMLREKFPALYTKCELAAKHGCEVALLKVNELAAS